MTASDHTFASYRKPLDTGGIHKWVIEDRSKGRAIALWDGELIKVKLDALILEANNKDAFTLLRHPRVEMITRQETL